RRGGGRRLDAGGSAPARPRHARARGLDHVARVDGRARSRLESRAVPGPRLEPPGYGGSVPAVRHHPRGRPVRERLPPRHAVRRRPRAPQRGLPDRRRRRGARPLRRARRRVRGGRWSFGEARASMNGATRAEACARAAGTVTFPGRGPLRSVRVWFGGVVASDFSRGREFDPPLESYHSAWFSTRSTQRRLNGGRVSSARKPEHPRVSVGCPYRDLIHGHRVRQRPPGSLRFFTHAMGRDGVGNAWKVNRTLEVGGSTPLGSTRDSARLACSKLSRDRRGCVWVAWCRRILGRPAGSSLPSVLKYTTRSVSTRFCAWRKAWPPSRAVCSTYGMPCAS